MCTIITIYFRFLFTPTDEEKEITLKKFNNNLTIPENFSTTATPYDGNSSLQHRANGQVLAQVNPQTMVFCDKLGIDDPMGLLLMFASCSPNSSHISTCSLPSFLTPEKPGDVTSVSLAEEESPAKPVRLSLNLPCPLNSDSISKSNISSSPSSLSNHLSQVFCSSRESYNQEANIIGGIESYMTADTEIVGENVEGKLFVEVNMCKYWPFLSCRFLKL